MNDIIRIGLDTSKSLFQLHGVDAAEQPVLRKRLRRAEMVKFFEKLPPVMVALEACYRQLQPTRGYRRVTSTAPNP